MNCFLLPITTCQEIEKSTARFFWGSTIEDRKHHWAGWDVLTTPIAKGGIGFREIQFFNLAMLAKQLWRLIISQNSLAFRILKAKYFPRVDILQAQLGYKPSYLWRSLLSARKVVEEERAWRIGNGASVSIINERWIGVREPTKPRGILPEFLQHQKVCHLINLDSMQWRETEIMEHFDEDETVKILSIPLSTSGTADCPIWRFTKHGLFTVKSAYHCAVETFSSNAMMRASPSTHQKEWKKIWDIKTSPRVKLFLWKACTDSLPTRVNLCRRGSTIDQICPICGEAAETIDHLLLRCRNVAKIWYLSALRIEVSRYEGLSFRQLLWDALEHRPAEFTSLLSYTAWEIWRARNSRCFEDKVFDEMSVQKVSHTRWMEEMECRIIAANLSPRVRTEVKQAWQKPRTGSRTLNCDAAEGVKGKVGLGFVLRDDEGNILLAGKTFCVATGSSTLIEAAAMRYALKMARQYHYQVDRVESDSQVLIKNIMGTLQPETYCDIIIKDIQQVAEELSCHEFAYISRKANQAAHQAAKGHEFISIGHTPSHLREVVAMEASH